MSESGLVARIDDLETRLTFIDDTVGALADADATQSRRLLALEQALHDLRSELASMRSALGDNPHDEPPPPHY